LSSDKPLLLKEIHKEPGTVWTTTKDRVLLYEVFERKLSVFDMNLEPAHHPLEDVVKQYKDLLNPIKDEIGFSRIRLHPTLPFAILYGGYEGSTFVGWAKDRNCKPHLLLLDSKEFSLSPDGKWATYKTSSVGKNSQTYIMPISEKYPHYLGSPILISKVSFNIGKAAWSTNPTAYVSSYGDNIFRWDLENQDFPEKGKMSFHDYIVQEDLKKLTREKKQGLGK